MLSINGAMDSEQRRAARRRIEGWKSAATRMRMDIGHLLKKDHADQVLHVAALGFYDSMQRLNEGSVEYKEIKSHSNIGATDIFTSCELKEGDNQCGRCKEGCRLFTACVMVLEDPKSPFSATCSNCLWSGSKGCDSRTYVLSSLNERH